MNEFSSERKLMSIVARDRIDGKVYIFAKGAESEIMSRLSLESQESPLSAQVEKEVRSFGNMGLRTLCFAMREMSEEEFSSTNWSDPS